MQRFQDSTLAAARTAGCDTVQIKYDGMFAQFSTKNGGFSATTPDGHIDAFTGVSPDIACILIGSYLPPLTDRKPSYFVHDCWLVEEPPNNIVDLRRETYRSRYVAARIQIKLLNGPFHLVQNHPISAAEVLWRTLPEIAHAKGLVFRNSKDPVGVQLRCARWYPEVPGELV